MSMRLDGMKEMLLRFSPRLLLPSLFEVITDRSHSVFCSSVSGLVSVGLNFIYSNSTFVPKGSSYAVNGFLTASLEMHTSFGGLLKYSPQKEGLHRFYAVLSESWLFTKGKEHVNGSEATFRVGCFDSLRF